MLRKKVVSQNVKIFDRKC